ncbi:MAG TPA: hypothetical protein VNH46_04145, partial [Gemmatimonadales bacterium]|nr:hypothetical protein [Gemmatimonadales bacterium]
SLRAAWHTVDAAVNIVRVYRGKEVMLEQTYRPAETDDAGSLREPFLAAEASRTLLESVDSLFGLLVAQQAGVVARANGLKFADPSAAAEYTVLREQIRAQIARWRDSAEAPNRVTMPRLLRALAGGPPPALR